MIMTLVELSSSIRNHTQC